MNLRRLFHERRKEDWKSSYPEADTVIGLGQTIQILQIGVPNGLSPTETRSHFGGWAIVSSPLVLSHDVNNYTIMDTIQNTTSNRVILQVNQAYFGDSGRVYSAANETIIFEQGKYEAVVPIYQFLSKPLSNNTVAVLLMNSGDNERVLESSFVDIPGFVHQSRDTYRIMIVMFVIQETQKCRIVPEFFSDNCSKSRRKISSCNLKKEKCRSDCSISLCK